MMIACDFSTRALKFKILTVNPWIVLDTVKVVTHQLLINYNICGLVLSV